MIKLALHCVIAIIVIFSITMILYTVIGMEAVLAFIIILWIGYFMFIV